MREKMSRNNRAKQFLPFDAMKGLQEALRAVEFENESVSHHRLSEDEAKRISMVLASLTQYCNIYVRYYENGHYQDYEGEGKLDAYASTLLLKDKAVPILDIYDLRLL